MALALAVPAGAAAAPKVDVLVVGKSATVSGPRSVPLKAARVKVGGKRCAVARSTPLAALTRMDVDFSLRDYATCSKRPADASGLYVHALEGEREKGAAGWVYKINNRTPGTGAGDPVSKLRGGDRLLWFWCRTGGSCQRSLVAKPERSAVAPGEALRVTVTAYDDNGNGVPARGATVTFGTATATADADGVATLTVGTATGRLGVVATKAGLVRSFPTPVLVS